MDKRSKRSSDDSIRLVTVVELVIFLFCVSCFAKNGYGQSDSSSSNVRSAPHPWLADAPGEFIRLIEKGNVRIEVDDPRIRKSGKAALTQFRFALDFDYRYRAEWLQPGAQSGVWRAKITAWLDQPKLNPEHTIYVPSTFQPNEPWRSKLIKHEFDHVAVSTDPRLIKIIQRILQRRKTWTETFEQATRPMESDIRERIRQDVEKTVKTCESMIQSKYDELDKQSSDGLSAIAHRKEFFLDLYSVEGLAKVRFEYLDLVKSFVADRLSSESSIREVETHYLFLK